MLGNCVMKEDVNGVAEAEADHRAWVLKAGNVEEKLELRLVVSMVVVGASEVQGHGSGDRPPSREKRMKLRGSRQTSQTSSRKTRQG